MVPTWAIALSSAVGLGQLLQLADGGDHRLVDAALQVHRVDPGGDGLEAFLDERLRQHGGGGGAVTGHVGGLGSGFLDDLRADVLVLVGQLDLLGDGDAVLGDRGGAEALLEHDVAALRTQRDLDRIGQGVHALEDARAGVFAEADFFSGHNFFASKKLNRNGTLSRGAARRSQRRLACALLTFSRSTNPEPQPISPRSRPRCRLPSGRPALRRRS